MANDKEGFALEITANIDGFNRKLAEARKGLEKFQREAGAIKVGGGSGTGAGAGTNASATNAQRKLTAGLYTMSTAVDGATRALARFTASVTAATTRAAAASAATVGTAGAAKAAGAAGAAVAGGGLMAAAPMALLAAGAAALPVAAVVKNSKGYLNAYRTQSKNELAVKSVFENSGLNAQDFEDVKKYAGDIQNRTIYGDETMLAAAGRLSSIIKDQNGKVDKEALKRMMDLLATYASGKTNNAALNSEQLTGLALDLGRAYNGQFRTMKESGFNTAELEELKKKEEKGKTVTAAEKIAAMERSFSLWANRAENFAKTAEGREIQMKNRLGDVEETIGQRIAPAWAGLMDSFLKNETAFEKFKGAVGDTFIAMIQMLTENMPKISAAMTGISKVVGAFAGNARLMMNIFEVIGGAAAGLAIAGAITGFKTLYASMMEATVGLNTFSTKMQIFSKSMIAQAALIGATVWAVGKIAQASGLAADLVGEEAKDAHRNEHYSNFNEYMSKVQLYQGRQNKMGLSAEEIAQARERMKSVPRGTDFSKIDYRSAGQYFQGLNQKQIDWMAAEFERQTWLNKAMGEQKAGAAVGTDPNKILNDALAGAKAAQTIVIDKSNKKVEQVNNIKVDEPKFAKVVKDNLEMLLTSHFRINNDLTGLQANAG